MHANLFALTVTNLERSREDQLLFDARFPPSSHSPHIYIYSFGGGGPRDGMFALVIQCSGRRSALYSGGSVDNWRRLLSVRVLRPTVAVVGSEGGATSAQLEDTIQQVDAVRSAGTGRRMTDKRAAVSLTWIYNAVPLHYRLPAECCCCC